jgi:hypothetical protein
LLEFPKRFRKDRPKLIKPFVIKWIEEMKRNKMFGWSGRSIKEFRSESLGEYSIVRETPRIKPGMCPEINRIAYSPLDQGFKTGGKKDRKVGRQ